MSPHPSSEGTDSLPTREGEGMDASRDLSPAASGVPRRYLQFRNYRNGVVDRRIDVTGRSEREIERCLRGMLINIGDDWVVDDVTDPDTSSPNDPPREASEPNPTRPTS